jgi:hypothetical protein
VHFMLLCRDMLGCISFALIPNPKLITVYYLVQFYLRSPNNNIVRVYNRPKNICSHVRLMARVIVEFMR